jgi:hypothetical protein
MPHDLKGAEVWRGGVTTAKIEKEADPVTVSYGRPHAHSRRFGLTLSTYIKSKGGGTTAIKFWIPPSDFEAIVSTMRDLDPEATKAAFLKAERN